MIFWYGDHAKCQGKMQLDLHDGSISGKTWNILDALLEAECALQCAAFNISRSAR